MIKVKEKIENQKLKVINIIINQKIQKINIKVNLLQIIAHNHRQFQKNINLKENIKVKIVKK